MLTSGDDVTQCHSISLTAVVNLASHVSHYLFCPLGNQLLLEAIKYSIQLHHHRLQLLFIL